MTTPKTKDAAPESDKGKLAVLVSGFVSRTNADSKSKATTRYRRGQEFHPVEGLHDVEELIRAKVIGRVGEAGTQPSRAIDVAQAQAEINQENSPVLDLTVQPFEQGKVEAGSGANPNASSAGGSVTS